MHRRARPRWQLGVVGSRSAYDEAFGAAQREDRFTARFEGRTFTFTLRGVASSEGCPAVVP